MTDDRFDYLTIWSDRIARESARLAESQETEIHRHSVEIQQLSEYPFRTVVERDLELAIKHHRSIADYAEKKLTEMRASRERKAA